MFDESEIRFLTRAVELRLLTPNQRQRLFGFQGQLPPGMKVTTLSVESGLMVQEEVAQVLASLASGIASPAGPQAVTANGISQVLEEDDRNPAKAIAGAIRSVMHGGEPPLDSSYNTMRENRDAAVTMQKFPLPGQGGMEQEMATAAGMQAPQPEPAIVIPESPLKQFAMSASEIDSLLNEPGQA
ncbi:MAG: hypothetical protein L6Q71_08725 [Planctomycetes bacterium]|nr:hypothetical protein [Planctomycetota bacterium]NUQ33399.1 hypothetical protein [Planctomycetaceae bacterium]